MTEAGIYLFLPLCAWMFCCVPLVDLVPVWCQESNPESRQTLQQLSNPVQVSVARCNPPCFIVPQVIVWGNYGRMERKQFMGVARVLLEELDLTTLAVGWYKLFPTSSMVDPATGPLLRQASQLSLESTVGPCGERS